MAEPRPNFVPLRRPPGRWRTALVVLLTAAVAACSGGGGGGPTDPGPTPSFTFDLSSGVLTLLQGTGGSVTVTVTRTGGFTGAVTVTVTGLPNGVTADPLTIASGMTSGQLTLDAAAGAAVGNANLTVRGNGTGVSERTRPLQLTVNSATAPGYTLAVAPLQQTVQAGSAVQSTVTITRTGGFAGAVTLAATGLPAGVTAGFSPAAPTGNTATLTLTAAQGASASGPTQVTIQGAATGLPNQSAQVTLTVTVPGGGGGGSGNVSVDFCQATGIPLWVAYQDGAGPWTQAAGAGPTWSFDILSNQGGVAWVLSDGADGFQTFVFYGTRQEITAFGTERCSGAPGAGKTVTGTLANVPGSGGLFPPLVTLALGDVTTSPQTPTNGSPVTFNGVRNGTVDLIGSVSETTIVGQNIAITPSRMLLRRNLNPAPGSSLGNLDFQGPDSFAPDVRALTLNGFTGGQNVFLLTTSIFMTPNGSGLVASSTGAGANWYGIPAGRLVAGDLHLLTASEQAFVDPIQGLANSRSVLRFIGAPSDQTLTLGPTLTAPGIVPLGGAGHQRARATYTIQNEYNRYWFAAFMQAPGGPSTRQAQIQMTDGYRGSTTGTVTLEIPEFSGVGSWNANWGLVIGTQVTWTVSGSGWVGGSAGVQPLPQEGNTFVTAARMGQFTAF